MSNFLSIRQQERFIAAFNNLVDSDRVHKKDINQINSIVNKLSKVEVSQAMLYSMGSSAWDPRALKNIFSNLFSKLDTQDSDMYKKKYAKLENIHNKLASIVDTAHNLIIKEKINILDKKIDHVLARINSAQDEIRSRQENIIVARNAIDTMQNEMLTLESVLKQTSDAEFAALDAQRTVEPPDFVRDYKSEYNNCLTFLDYRISEQRRCKNALVNFANVNYVDIEQDLRKAEHGEIRSDGLSWGEHMASKSYAIGKFGSKKVATPSVLDASSAGKEWQTLMDNFNQSLEKIHDLQLKKDSVEEDVNAGIMKQSNMSTREKVIYDIRMKEYWTLNFKNILETESDRIEINQNIITKMENRKEDLLNQKWKLYTQVI